MLGAVAVVATLFYFGLQLKGQAAQMRVQQLRAQAAEEHQIAMFQASPHMLDVIEKCFKDNRNDLTFKERVLMESYIDTHLATINADFKLHRDGLLDDESWSGRLQVIATLFAPDWVQQYWESSKLQYDKQFTEIIDDTRGSLDTGKYFDMLGSKLAE